MKVKLTLRNHSREVQRRDDGRLPCSGTDWAFLLLKGIIRTLGETCIGSYNEGYYFCNFFFASVRLFQNKKGKMEKRGKKIIGITCTKY